MSGKGVPVFLLAEDISGLALGADTEALASEHPLWADAVAELGPWVRSGSLLVDRDGDDTHSGRVAGWVSTKTFPTRIILCRSCSSVLDVAWKLQRHGLLKDWDAVMAVQQWAGRGQARRFWSSLPGNLHVAWSHPSIRAGWSGLVSLIPAWIASRVLSASGGWELRIKWPNDLLYNDCKVGGVLVEQRGEEMLAGLGLNLSAAPNPLGERNPPMRSAALKSRINPVQCWNALVSEYVAWYKTVLPRIRPQDFIQVFSQSLAWKDRDVYILEHGQAEPLPVRILGVSSDGGLLVSVQGERRTFFSGEVRLVLDGDHNSFERIKESST